MSLRNTCSFTASIFPKVYFALGDLVTSIHEITIQSSYLQRAIVLPTCHLIEKGGKDEHLQIVASHWEIMVKGTAEMFQLQSKIYCTSVIKKNFSTTNFP